MTLSDARFKGKDFGKMTNYFYMESAVKQAIKELNDIIKNWEPKETITGFSFDKLLLKQEIEKVFGKELTENGGKNE